MTGPGYGAWAWGPASRVPAVGGGSATCQRRLWVAHSPPGGGRLLPRRHPEPDHALDHDRAVVADAADPDREVGVVRGPLSRVGLGDAGDVAGGLGGVADLHPLRDPPL